MKYLQALIYG